MPDTQKPPIEPGPEPDTTDAATADDVESELDPEEPAAVIDERGRILGHDT